MATTSRVLDLSGDGVLLDTTSSPLPTNDPAEVNTIATTIEDFINDHLSNDDNPYLMDLQCQFIMEVL